MRDDFDAYQATARTFVRAGWFYDFVEALFTLYLSNRKLELSDIAREAYTERLAFRHVWILRHPARWAMSLVASRQHFNDSFCAEQSKVLNRPYTEQELYDDCTELTESITEMRTYINAYLSKHNMLDLP